MFTTFLIVTYKLFRGRIGSTMLVRLFASEILMENLTINDVPRGLMDGVRKYLEDMGYDFTEK